MVMVVRESKAASKIHTTIPEIDENVRAKAICILSTMWDYLPTCLHQQKSTSVEPLFFSLSLATDITLLLFYMYS